MTTDAVGYILAVLALGMSFLTFKNRHILLVIGNSALWAALLAYFLANSTAGANWQQIFILAVVAFMVAILIFNWQPKKFGSEGLPPEESPKGMMDLSADEYRDRPRRRSRKRI